MPTLHAILHMTFSLYLNLHSYEKSPKLSSVLSTISMAHGFHVANCECHYPIFRLGQSLAKTTSGSDDRTARGEMGSQDEQYQM